MTTNNMVQMRRIPRWTFADRVRKIRRDTGLNQSDFAERLGVGDRALAAWESGRTMPRDVVAIANDIWKQFRVPPTWTLGLEDSYGGPPDDDPQGLPWLDSDQQPAGYTGRELGLAA